MAIEFKRLEEEFGKYGSTAIFSNILLFVLFCGLISIAHYLTDSSQLRIYNYLVILLGALCGWAIGIFFSPYTDEEAKKFVSIGQAISAFVSGYALSKFDRFLEASLFAESKLPQYEVWTRLALFSTAALLFALLIFTNRAYFRTDEPQPKKKPSPKKDQSVNNAQPAGQPDSPQAASRQL